MPTFDYIATDASGMKQSGSLTAANRQDALTTLSRRSLIPLKLHESTARTPLWNRVSGKDRAAMFSLLADLLESGVSLVKSLDILVEQTSHPKLKSILQEVQAHVVDGAALADAMTEQRDVFNDLSISMVRAGEEGGFLEDSLKRIASFTEKQDAMRGKVLGALAYPMFLLVVGTLVVVGMIVFFVPRFAPLFDRLQASGELPIPTVLLLGLSEFLCNFGIWIGLALFLAGMALVRFATTDLGREMCDAAKLRTGMLGTIFRQLAIARFCRALGTLLANGVPMLKSLQIAREATANRILSVAIANVSENVQSGRSLVEPLAACRQFPTEILEMIHVGEQSNRLETLLVDIADKLEDRTQRKLDVLVKLIEPSLMLVMALLIGFLVVALLLPVFESSGSLG